MSQRHTHALFDTDKVQVCFGKEAKVDFGSQAGLCKFDLLAVDLPVELARHAADVRVNRPSAIRCRSRSAACRQLNIIAAILEPPVIEKILTHLGLQARAPARATARGQALLAARPSRAITVHATRRASQSLRASPDPPQNEPMSSKRRAPKTAAVMPEGATRDPVVVAPAPSRFDRVIARLKTLKGAVVAIAGVGAVLGGLVGYWNAYQAARASTQSSSCWRWSAPAMRGHCRSSCCRSPTSPAIRSRPTWPMGYGRRDRRSVAHSRCVHRQLRDRVCVQGQARHGAAERRGAGGALPPQGGVQRRGTTIPR